ncbi:MAG: hypothetical protein QOE86_4439 [Solirubrobacteraceae bacterium]|nr:hypothetical protein [Solirubrobacteraceae bacterium]
MSPVVGLALVLANADGGVTAWGMVGPNLVGGIGMGMMFQAVQQLGMSLGVAIAGTVLGSGRGRAADFLHAREVTCAASAALGRARAGGGVPEPAAA